MKTNRFARLLSLVLAFTMVFSLMTPVTVFADETETINGEELTVSDYGTFLNLLKVLEGYAEEYAEENITLDPETFKPVKPDSVLLVLNYIRTGVPKYMDDNWTTLAGKENTDFKEYVAKKDAENGTTAYALKNLENFFIPNGQEVEFDHMFGTMNIAYFNPGSADLGGWSGDLCDLINCVKDKGGLNATTLEEMIAEVAENHLFKESGIAGLSSFGQLDYYGDLDAFYFVTKMKSEGGKLSTWCESYYTASLTDADRAAFFLNNRFNGLLTKEAIREAAHATYTGDSAILILEAKRGIKKDEHADLRKACCYAFADYVFELADGRLTVNPEGPGEGGEGGEGEGGEGGEGEGGEGGEVTPGFNYFTVFDTKESILAPGITQTVKTARTADNKQIIYYIATVDVNRSDVSVHANYTNNDPSKGWAMSKVVSQMAAAQERHSHIENYNTIVGVNADFFNMSNGKPSGALVMEGVTYNPGSGSNFFGILDDGTPIIGGPSDWATYADRLVEAVGGSQFLVKNGESVVAYAPNYNLNRASRTCVGITADNQVVMMVLDGRQEPRSAGGSMQELAQIMIEAGCVVAINLDGGGSTTFAAKQEGSNDVTVVNKPSDGFARSVSSSLLVVSTAKISNEFYYAKLNSEFDYLTVGSSVVITATGVSGSGHSAEIPANAYWQVSDPTKGSIIDGVFTALALGDVDVQLVVDGNVVGSKTLHVIIPDKLEFANDTLNAIYGVPVELPLNAYYNNIPAAINIGDVNLLLSNGKAGSFQGMNFIGDETSNLRKVTAGAVLVANNEIFATIKLSLFKTGEATFDFDNATAGDKILAWNRVVQNSMTSDNYTYHAVVPLADMPIEYTFALDMTEIGIPEKFNDLIYRLPAPEDGSEPTAWGYLLSLAERVSVLTEVEIVAQFDADLAVDVSGIQVSNEYFEIKEGGIQFDPLTNTLTLVCNWIDQTEAIDPATANPICILSGIKAIAKDGAAWDADSNLPIVNVGVVSYDIYLRASSLYSFAQEPANQEQYGLIPFENPDVIIGGSTEKGAHYQSTYTTFADSYVLNNGILQGWHQVGDFMHYYVNHEPLKNGIYKLPGFTAEDRNSMLYYCFDENGGCIGTYKGFVEELDGVIYTDPEIIKVIKGDLYYINDGKPLTGWQVFDSEVLGEDTVYYYYFDPVTGLAADGACTIGGYNYVFEDNILVKGQFVTNSTGIRYMWAGSFASQEWITVDGKKYYAESNDYLTKGIRTFAEEGVAVFYIFDNETGVWMEDYTGFYEVPKKVHDFLAAGTCWVENGIVVKYAGLLFVDGDYYYVPSNGVIVKGRTYYVESNKTNGWLPAGSYTFGDDGKMIIPKKAIIFYMDKDNGEFGELYKTLEVAIGAKIALPEAPTKEGYTFVKWSPTLPSVMPSENLEVYAEWEIGEFTITFDTDGGSAVDSITADYGTAITAPATVPTKEGYTFAGWDNLPATMPGEDTTVKAKWNVNKYTITFEDGYGEVVETIEQDYGTAIDVDSIDVTKAPIGYSFAGWDTEIPETMPAKNMTIKATWETAKYTITFVTGGGTEIPAITGEYGTPVTRPANPTRDGYMFAGWDSAIPSVITGNVTITAKWRARPYTITFNTDGGTAVASIRQDYESEVAEPTAPTKAGYTFAGWVDADGKAVQFPITMPLNGMTLKAKWTVNQYTITFDTDGGTSVDAITADFGTAVTKPADPTKTGYTFAGWDTVVPATVPDENVTIKAKWTINQYTITFDTDGGSEIAQIKQDYATAVTKPADPTKEGYTFAGWDTEIPDTIPAENVTVKAKWTINQYTITFDTDGGSEIESITLDYGSAIERPANPTKEGNNFGGWSPSIPETMPAQNITVKAIWNVGKFTIEFNTNGGSKIDSITADFGAAVTKPADPTRDGYDFIGWDKEIPETMPDEYLVINAQWKAKEYTITFNTDGGSAVDAITADFGAAVTKPADPTKTGYTFAGWSPAIPQTMPVGGLEVTALWTINQYTITFDTDGGSAVDAITADFGTAVTTPTAPTKTGYTFAGWDVAVPATMPAKNITITAKWTINQYTITFDTDGGTAVAPITQDYATAVTAPAAPTKTGYTFAGWDKEIPATITAENVTIKAEWTINQYTITFDSVGGTAVDSITADFGTAVTAPEAPTKTGYTFAGWENLPATMPAENVTIKALWTINQYTITFNTDGGTAVDAITADFGAAVTKPADPTKEGYTFAGWDTEIPATMPAENVTIKAEWTINQYTITFETDGVGEVKAITADFGSAIVAPEAPTKTGYTFAGWNVEVPATMPAGDMTITAQWTINQYTITFDTDGGKNIAPITQNFGTEVTKPVDPVKLGYTFAGWDTEIPATMPAENVTIKASWTVNQYTITFDTDGGTAVDAITADFGTAIVAPEAPTKEGYTFVGWSSELPETMPAEDLTLTAVWEYTYTGWLEEGGKTTYLVNGKKAYADEFATIEDNKYYFDADGYVAKGMSDVDDTTYIFDEETGALKDVSGLYNNGEDTYYVNEGEVVKFAGLVNIDGDYYYFGENNKALKNGKFTIEKTNDLAPAGEYEFDADGKMDYEPYIIGDTDDNGVVDNNDAIYLLYNTIFGDEDYPLNQDCDFDGSGAVDNNDAIYLLYHTIFGEEEYPLV